MGKSLMPAPKGWAQLEQLFPTCPSEFGGNRPSTGSAEMVSALLVAGAWRGQQHRDPRAHPQRGLGLPQAGQVTVGAAGGGTIPISRWSRMGVTGPRCHCPEPAKLPPPSSSSSWSVSSSEGLAPRWGRALEGCSFSRLQPRPAGDGQREWSGAGRIQPLPCAGGTRGDQLWVTQGRMSLSRAAPETTPQG